MISKILIFFNLSKSLFKVLTTKEKRVFFIYLIVSVFNTILEIISISIIILLLLLISGQDISDSKLSSIFEIIPFEQSVFNISYLMISIVILKTIFQIIFTYNQEKIAWKITKRINIKLYENFINSKYIDYINENSPKLIRIFNQESVRLGNQLISPFITMINETFLLILIMSFVFFYDPFLGIAFCLMSIVLLFSFNISINKVVKGLGKTISTSNTSRIKLINETFKGFDIIKLFNKNETFKQQFSYMTNKVTNASFKNIFYLKLPKSIFEVVIFGVVFAMIIVFSITNNEKLLISYLSVSAVTIYKVIPSLNKLSNSFQGIQFFSIPFKEIVDYLSLEKEKLYSSLNNDFSVLDFKNLTFNYKDDKILNDIDFQIRKYDFIGIYGPSGSGKSTFIKIISGLMNPDFGNVLLDRINISSIQLRNFCSYVPQDSVILDEDIFTNVSLEFKKSQINKEKVLTILEKVGLYEKFSNNMNISLGESGIKISGGQKQRIAIARALYHKKRVLILDESTSNLDSMAESNIIQLLQKLNSEITIIIVSHKESSLKECNKVYEINHGKINLKL